MQAQKGSYYQFVKTEAIKKFNLSSIYAHIYLQEQIVAQHGDEGRKHQYNY